VRAAIDGGLHGEVRCDLTHSIVCINDQCGAITARNRWPATPTNDAAVAMEGLIQPIGGHKGVGLGIIIGILSTFLSGASYGSELGNMIEGPKPGKDGHLFAAIDIAAFQPIGVFKKRVDEISHQIQSSRRQSGIDWLYPPRLLEAEFERKYAGEGIPLNKETIGGIRAAALQVGIASDLFA
jgi:LDH2 family malate/lactate/ureidoglycolate dehydrogenase